MRMLYSYFFASRYQLSSEELWATFRQFVSSTLDGVLFIADVIKMICHDQKTIYHNQDPWIILVVDEMLLLKQIFGSEIFHDVVHRLGEFLDRQVPLLFFTSSLSERISQVVKTSSGRTLHRVSLPQLDRDTAFTLCSDRLKATSVAHLLDDKSVRCAVVECFGVPRFLSQLCDTLEDERRPETLQALRKAIACKLYPVLNEQTVLDGLAACFCLPLHLNGNTQLLLTESENEQITSIKEAVFTLEEQGILFNFSTAKTPRFGIPPMLLSAFKKPKNGIQSWVTGYGNDDNVPGDFWPRKLERQMAAALRILHWRDQICSGVSLQSTYSFWCLPCGPRSTTTVAQMLNLAAVRSLELSPKHTAYSALRLSDSDMELKPLEVATFATLPEGDCQQFTLLEPTSTNFPGCDLIIAAPMESGDVFFIVVECKMTENPSDTKHPLGENEIASKLSKCLSKHPLLLAAFLAKRLCYIIGGIRPAHSATNIHELLVEQPPELPKQETPLGSATSSTENNDPVQKVIAGTVESLMPGLSVRNVEDLSEQSVIVLDRDQWTQILTPTLAFRPQFDPSFLQSPGDGAMEGQVA